MKKKVNKNILLLTSLMMWLLLLCSSPESVANEILKPTLKLSKEEIDICSNLTTDREFVITVELDLGRAITVADSLILCEFVLAYSKDKIILEGTPYTMGTLSEGFADKEVKIDATSNANYNKFIFNAGNTTKPVSGNQPLVRIAGRYTQDKIDCAVLFIESFYLNEEFKVNYITSSDAVILCANPKNLPNRKVDLYAKNDTFHIEKLDDTLSIDYELAVTNKKFLTSFTVEFAVSSESSDKIEINDFNINSEQFEYNLVEQDSSKIVLDVSIKDTANFDIKADFGNLQLTRKNKDSSENEIICRVYNINESSCSMNNESRGVVVVCFEDDTTGVRIENRNDEMSLFFCENEKKVYITDINDLKNIKIYNVLGNEFHCEKEISTNLITVDISCLKSGVYFLTVEKNNSTKNIKLTIK